MNRGLLAYQVKIKINAFRLRRQYPLPLPARPVSSAVPPPPPAAPPAQSQISSGSSPFFTPHALACTAEAKQILETNLDRHYSVPVLARKAGFNSSSLQACFQHLYGKTIFEFGQDLRLEHAKKLLLETDQTNQEIAEACGYPEQANFSTAFKKKYGVAPGRWRKGGDKNGN